MPPPSPAVVAGSAREPVPAEVHQARAAAARETERGIRRRSARISAARLTLALAAAALGLWSLDPASPRGSGWAALVAALAFGVLVVVHERVLRQAQWHRTVGDWHDTRLLRLAREWIALPPPQDTPVPLDHPYAHDLDVVGRASLLELIGQPGTPAGRATLRAWLLQPAEPGEVHLRQTAARELQGNPDLRERLFVQGALIAAEQSFDVATFLEWTEEESWLERHSWVVRVARGLTLGTLTLIAAQAYGLIAGAWWVVSVTAGLALSWAVRERMAGSLGAAGREPAIRGYSALLEMAERETFSAERLRRIQTALGEKSHRASREIRSFQRLVALADLRHAPLLHFPVHALTLWDFHVWWALERWRTRSGLAVRGWLHAVGELEALAALAALAADHPEWTWPGVLAEAALFDARDLGHPLIRPDRCVRNDVRVGPRGRVLCVTGSNMSGKSTLLRAIGTNAVLAQAGGPVCASALRLPPLQPYTSVHVSDSLAQGVSYFMAALGRLKAAVDAADAAQPDAGHPAVLYLLDEILQGTNSAERAIAVRLVLRHLLATPAIGAITTHDLSLTTTPELSEHGDHVHLRETIEEVDGTIRMSFDYRLRPGIATSRNALALMRMIGLLPSSELSNVF